jgi:hypothetical protein
MVINRGDYVSRARWQANGDGSFTASTEARSISAAILSCTGVSRLCLRWSKLFQPSTEPSRPLPRFRMRLVVVVPAAAGGFGGGDQVGRAGGFHMAVHKNNVGPAITTGPGPGGAIGRAHIEASCAAEDSLCAGKNTGFPQDRVRGVRTDLLPAISSCWWSRRSRASAIYRRLRARSVPG